MRIHLLSMATAAWQEPAGAPGSDTGEDRFHGVDHEQ